jgi:hypothetical protein
MKSLGTLLAGIIVLVGIYLIGAYTEYSSGFPFAMLLDSGPVAPLRTPPPSRNAPVASDYGAPASSVPVSSLPSAVIPQSSTTRTDVPIVSRAQGAQDAARSDVPMGEKIDLQRCYDTMIARKLIPTEAKTVCAKLIGGISH